jgi:3-phenylpropionate/trans-cinnamate dioxygenase ferredoxin subunit
VISAGLGSRRKHRLAFPASELPPGARRVVQVGRREIAVWNVDGKLYALKNRCPHQQAPLIAGAIGGTRLESPVGEYRYGLGGRVLRCPWHAYEFDLATGACLVEGDRFRVAAYEIGREGEEIAVYV